MHGGAIGFASKAGVGSIFAFYIKGRMCVPSSPPVPPQQETSPVSENGTGARGNLTVPLPAPGMSSKASHILIVEDNLVNQRVLAKQLGNLGVQVAVANHGGEALDFLRSTRYYCRADDEEAAAGHPLSLILMDWEMPVMDGLTCVRNIRQLQREGVMKGHVPVIGITANVRSEQVHDALEAGMDNVISKPFRIPELCACIEKTIRTLSGRHGQSSV